MSEECERKFIMHQINGPKQTFNTTIDLVREKTLKVLDWLIQSPNPNLIELHFPPEEEVLHFQKHCKEECNDSVMSDCWLDAIIASAVYTYTN